MRLLTADGLAKAGLAVSPLLLAGCTLNAHAPSISVFGSFFPVWIISAALGVVAMLLLRKALIGMGIDQYLPVSPVVYLCLTVLVSIVLWFLWSGGIGR